MTESIPVAKTSARTRSRSKTMLEPQTTDLSSAFEQLRELHLGLAGRICSEQTPLTATEFDFLCTLTGTSDATAQKVMQIDRETLAGWRQSNCIPAENAVQLKEFAWKVLVGRNIEQRPRTRKTAAAES